MCQLLIHQLFQLFKATVETTKKVHHLDVSQTRCSSASLSHISKTDLAPNITLFISAV
jgi:hypothetical protein